MDQAPPPPPPETRSAALMQLMSPEEDTQRRGCSGCTWGVAGAFGCFSLLALPIVVALVLGVTTLSSIVSGVTSIFNPPPPTLVFNMTTILEKIQDMSMLTTTRYNYSGIVTVQTDMPALLNSLYGRQLMMVAVGSVTAGIDLSKLTEADMANNDGVLTLNLPAPTLQDCFLNEQDTEIVERSGGPFSGATGRDNLDVESRRYAVRQFRDKALESGILNEVKLQSQIALAQFIGALQVNSIREVRISFADPLPDALLPQSCQ